jgi:peptide/nickel transport system substrate-binding protein
MRSSLRAKVARTIAAFGLALASLLPAATVHAKDLLTLRVGTVESLDSLNPFETALNLGYEVFTLNYDLLVNFGQDMGPAPGFAKSWAVSADGLTYTFHLWPGLKWSDGQAATSADVVFTYNYVLKNPKPPLGLGYLDPYLTGAGVTAVTAPDAATVVITLKAPYPRILQAYVPILPAHIWAKVSQAAAGTTFTNAPTASAPVVGSGPYQAVEWKVGQYIRFVRNANYWGPTGAADEVIIEIFKSSDTMVQALKSGQIDYAYGPTADEFNSLKGVPKIVTVAGTGNGFEELGFNCYNKPIAGGGASTRALQDPAFRDALGYAIDKPTLVAKVVKGYGTPGTTMVPPFDAKWHIEPTDVRTFDLGVADQKLTAAGYLKNAQGARLDKQGKVLNLSLYYPSDSTGSSVYANDAQFIKQWFGQLGITVTVQKFDSNTLTNKELPPEAGGTASFDLFIWGWGGDPDPNALLKIFTTAEIGSSSDSLWSNAQYDKLYTEQNTATDDATRKIYMDQMQNLMYDQAPYHILYYDATLVAYRTDRFSGWSNQPVANGTPLFGYGSFTYTTLLDATAATPSPTAVAVASSTTGASGPAATPAPSATPAPAASGDMTPIVLGGGALVVIIALAIVYSRLRFGGGRRARDNEDE